MGTAASVTVVICCHNSAARLPATLAHLARQRTPAVLDWEVLVVDNASTDATATIARDLWPDDAPAPLRVVSEPAPGQAHARRRGFEASDHDVLAFVDDDNWVEEGFIAEVARIFAAHADVGACGARGVAVFEAKPPARFGQLAHHYAIGSQGEHEGYVPVEARKILWGAGLSIRRAALAQLYAAGFEVLLGARTGGSLMSGDDAELCFALRLAGWELYYSPTLAYRHYMPAGRLTWEYARKLQDGLGRSSVPLKHYELRLEPAFGHSRLLAARDTWLGETVLSVVGVALAAARAAVARQRRRQATARLWFKWGKLAEILIRRRAFSSERASVERFVAGVRAG